MCHFDQRDGVSQPSRSGEISLQLRTQAEVNFSPFSCPISWGLPALCRHLSVVAQAFRPEGRCSQSEWLLFGRVGLLTSALSGSKNRSGGTGKAEAVKLPGAGIGPKQCPRKCAAEKRWRTAAARGSGSSPIRADNTEREKKAARVRPFKESATHTITTP